MRTHRLSVLLGTSLVALGLVACGTGSGSGSGGNGKSITIWEGYTGPEGKAFAHLITEYQQQNPGTKVNSLYVNNDNSLQKVLTAVRGVHACPTSPTSTAPGHRTWPRFRRSRR